MSGTEECQSTVSESHFVGPSSNASPARQSQVDVPHGSEMIGKVEEDSDDNGSVNTFLKDKCSIFQANADVMDSEISSIMNKKEPAPEGMNSANETDEHEHEDKSVDTAPFSGRVSSDFEVAALSPCFPLIRDKDDLEIPNPEVQPSTIDTHQELSNKQKCATNSFSGDLDISCGSNESGVKEGITHQSDESQGIQSDNFCSSDRDSSRKVADHIGVMYEESRSMEENIFKDNIVSSSMDKTNVFCNEKDGGSSTSDICDSSRESINDSGVDDSILEKDQMKLNLNDNDLSDGEIDENTEVSGDVSFVSSIDDEDDKEPTPYNEISENIYLIDKKKTRLNKEIRRIRCDCIYEPDEPGFVGCGANCLNRLLMIECGNKCSCGEFCTNKNFQKGCAYNLEVFQAGKKGLGVRTNERIESGVFIIEYCGEVVNYKEFMGRTEKYDEEKRIHYYFMLLKGDEVIDATKCGSISRFINHSCDPNCVTQKWTVNGFLRVGFFSLREISAGEELTFDYQYQRYGEKAQKCFCGSDGCRGVIGGKQMVLKPSGSNGETSKKRSKKKVVDYTSDYKLEDDLNELLGEQHRISTSKQALELTRLMVKTETIDDRCTLLKIVRDQSESKALKAFIRYKGLSLLWSWMVDTPSKDLNFRAEVLSTLKMLPIPNRNHLVDSKILPLVEKWSRSHDSPDSTRSDEEGSSSENEAAAAARAAAAGSEEEAKRGKMEVDKNTKDEKRKCASDVKGASTDDESDNSEKNEEVGSMANELLNRWKDLREVYKIPKKTQLTPEHAKLNPDASASPSEEKRFGKRKMDSLALSSSSKRPFAVQNASSPIRPLVQDSLGIPTFSTSPTQSSTGASSTSKNAIILGNADSSLGELLTNPKADHNQRNVETADLGDNHHRGQPRNSENKSFHDEAKPMRGHSRFGRGNSSLSWRNSPKFQNDFVGNQDKNTRGGRSGRGKQRHHRGKGNFSPFGHQQHQFNEKKDWSSVSSNIYAPKDIDSLPSRDFMDGNFSPQIMRPYPDSNRMPSPYQALPHHHRERPKDFVPSDVPHFDRQEHVHGERHEGNMQRFNPLRLSSPNLNRFGKPGQDWQQSPGHNMPFGPYPGQTQPRFNPTAMPSNASTPPRMPPNPPPQQFGAVPSTGLNIPNQSNLPMQTWNQNWSVPPQQGFPPPNLPPQGVANQNMNPLSIVGQRPSLSNPSPIPLPPFSLPHQQRLPGQPIIQQQNQQPPPPQQQQQQQQQQHHMQQQQQQHQQQQLQQQQQQQRAFLDAPHKPPFSQVPAKPIGTDTTSDTSQSTPASIIKHLHELAQQSRLVEQQKYQATEQQQQQQQQPQPQPQQQPQQQQQLQQQQTVDYGSKTPETATDSGLPSVTPAKNQRIVGTPPPSDCPTKTVSSLPPNWKTATDPEGKVYYYHVVTRKTQWDVPKWEKDDLLSPSAQQKLQSGPRTPIASPPHSPISPAILPQRAPAISDPSVSTTRVSNAVSGSSEQLTPKQQKMRDHFKTKLSAVVVNCLNPYQKVDCKQARIAKVEDFKFLARKLTHGLMMKELARVKTDEELECNDSVKIKVKEYIRTYMKRFGQFYIRS